MMSLRNFYSYSCRADFFAQESREILHMSSSRLWLGTLNFLGFSKRLPARWELVGLVITFLGIFSLNCWLHRKTLQRLQR